MRDDDTLAMEIERITALTLTLVHWCRERDWAGYDPYDALNSDLLRFIPFADARLPRLALTQLLKRSPLNLRPLLRVRVLANPKGIALFLSALVKLHRLGAVDAADMVGSLADRLALLRSPNGRRWCWGYNFPWQTRTRLIERYAPNLVCTTFVANALLDCHELSHDPAHLEMAQSAGAYVRNELYFQDEERAAFAYPAPSERTPIHNASLLGAALLCRLYGLTGDEGHRDVALRVTRYTVSRQREDGSWLYGEAPTQAWVDNFHTGYNLCALRTIATDGASAEFDDSLRRGFAFYREHFVASDGMPRYFHDRAYPIDVHCAAQSIITLVVLRDLHGESLTLAWRVLAWTLRHMFDSRGFFYYQRRRGYTNRIPYVRWSQAWMALALATLLDAVSLRTTGTRR
jgi:hypothetical protein